MSVEIQGLDEAACRAIEMVFANTSGLEMVVLYGSRAKGTFRANSDIDLAIHGRADPEALALELDELPLPWTFDVRSYEAIRSRALREHVDRIGIEIWRV